MRHIWLGITLLLLAPRFLAAQTITLGPIAKTVYCVGDTIVVPYQASGTFGTDNFFTAQLSDDTSSFIGFSNLGHDSLVSSSFKIRLSNVGAKYRVRVSSTDPYIISPPFDSDIAVLPHPHASPRWNVDRGMAIFGDYAIVISDVNRKDAIWPIGFVSDPIGLNGGISEPAGSTFLWFFDQDASPSKASSDSVRVSYSTPGIKTGKLVVSNRAGCSDTTGFLFRVLTCSPIIPRNVHIVTGSEGGGDSAVWVKAGANYTAGAGYQLIFVEPGGAAFVGGSHYCVFYLKPGASFARHDVGFNTVVMLRGQPFDANQDGVDSFNCTGLAFDYSQVSGSVNDIPQPSITISQNSNHLRITDDQPATTCRIFFLLGTELLSQRGEGKLDVDLTLLPAGMYFAIVQAGDERVVRKIVVAY